ncbi:unnamed protein product [Cladocopium goreaui]|uniref:ATP-dependent DNA helicase PcrA (DNA 3'-5 ' helicase PcrA) n=1 Tax=Cladocopium goreaui TaxID=2562237 RepID=A0A9P1GSX1_9DINO|nr:unnamed protein product [Cladocopium goreaui]
MAILLLGGEPDRDSYAAQLSFEFHPPLEVFASSPSSGALERLSAVDRINKLVLSYEALDTVTNFSTMIPRLQEAGVKKVLLVTSSYHMPRARAIAGVMLGASGIDFEAREVESTKPPEPRWKIWRAWFVTVATFQAMTTEAAGHPIALGPYWLTAHTALTEQRLLLSAAIAKVQENGETSQKVTLPCALRYLHRRKGSGTVPPSGSNPTLTAVAEEYEKALDSNKSVDYTDLISMAGEVLRLPVVAETMAKLQAVVVDEFQDTSMAQLQMLQEMLSCRPSRLTAVGDPRQRIFSFQGSASGQFKAFQQKFHARELTLEENFRSTGHICGCATSILGQAGMDDPTHPMLRSRHPAGNGLPVTVAVCRVSQISWIPVRCRTVRCEEFHARSWVLQQKLNGGEWRDLAILARTTATAQSMANSLQSLGVPVVLAGLEHYSQKEEWHPDRLPRDRASPEPSNIDTSPARRATGDLLQVVKQDAFGPAVEAVSARVDVAFVPPGHAESELMTVSFPGTNGLQHGAYVNITGYRETDSTHAEELKAGMKDQALATGLASAWQLSWRSADNVVFKHVQYPTGKCWNTKETRESWVDAGTVSFTGSVVGPISGCPDSNDAWATYQAIQSQLRGTDEWDQNYFKVMILPSSWLSAIGLGTVGGSLSWYRDTYVKHPAMFLHEIGHNWKLHHAGGAFVSQDWPMGLAWSCPENRWKIYRYTIK